MTVPVVVRGVGRADTGVTTSAVTTGVTGEAPDGTGGVTAVGRAGVPPTRTVHAVATGIGPVRAAVSVPVGTAGLGEAMTSVLTAALLGGGTIDHGARAGTMSGAVAAAGARTGRAAAVDVTTGTRAASVAAGMMPAGDRRGVRGGTIDVMTGVMSAGRTGSR